MWKTRKVLLLVENAPVPGDPRVWNEALALRDAGYQVCIIAPQSPTYPPQTAYSYTDGIIIYRFRLLEARSKYLAHLLEYISAFWQIFWLSLRVWRRHGFDVIHAANPPDFFFLLGLFYRCFAKKFVFDQHDLAPELFRVLFQARARPLYRMLCVLERCSYRFAHVVLTANESFRHLALERGGCSPEKVFVVRNGPNLTFFRPDGPMPDPPFPNRKKYVLIYIGVMGEQDGVKYALYALHDLVYIYGHRDVSAVFIGSGSALPELQALVRQLELDEYTFFPGWLERDKIVSYLASADVGLQPDPQNGLNEFCTMLKATEYMAMGLPFVAFDLLETRLLAEDAALYARPNEVADFARQLNLLLDCEELRRAMGATGRKRAVEIINWEYSRKNLLMAYEKLFSGQEGVDAEIEYGADKRSCFGDSGDL